LYGQAPDTTVVSGNPAKPELIQLPDSLARDSLVSAGSLPAGSVPDSLARDSLALTAGSVPDSLALDSLTMPDSLALDSLATPDSLALDSLATPERSGSEINSEVDYTATDSLVFALDGGKVELYGEARITFEDIELTADYILYEMDKNLVTAFGIPDSTGKAQGNPIFTDPSGSFESKRLQYNFKTQRGYIEEVVTEQEGGFLHSEETKKHQNGHIHLKNGKYTTCDAEHPHFYIAITKGISMPGDKIVSGPAYIVLADVPLPLGIPFGFFPNSKTKTSGIIIPKYGEETRRGFFLRDGGYYFAMNDYMDLKLTGDIYSNGTWGLRLGSNYRLNYRFTGNLSLQYYKNVTGYQNIEGQYSVSRDYRIGWSHSQDSRANPTSSFRASVNLSSSSYDRNHTRNINSVMTNTKQSSISYSKSWPNSPFNMSASLNHSQNSNTGGVNMTLPKIALNMGRINPFKRKVATGPKRWYEDIQLSYSSILENRISTYDSLLFTSSVFDDMKNGYRHNIPLSLAVKPFRRVAALQSFAITPSLNYTGMVYTRQTVKWVTYEEEDDGQGGMILNPVINDSLINKFSYAQSLFPSISSGLSPKLYGTYQFRGNGRMEVIRHVMTPTASMSFVPDLSAIQADYFRVLTDPENGGDTLQIYSIYEDQIYGTPTSRGASGSVNFSLRNNIEAKMRSRNDTIDELEKVSLLDNLSFSTSYNMFHTDTLSPAWRPISFNGNTRLFKNKLNLSFRGTMDPFGYDETRSRTTETYFSQTGRPIRLTNASISAGFSLQSRQGKDKDESEQPDQESRLNNPDQARRDPMETYDPNVEDYYGEYVDFDIPWSMRVDYSFSYSRPRDASTEKIVQTVRASGDFSLSPKWKIGFNTGYDLDRKQFTTTNLSIYRDLHCWEMRISVVPFGEFKSYNFQINAKSTILQDLKYKKNKSWQDNF
jgi:hypothetical protein